MKATGVCSRMHIALLSWMCGLCAGSERHIRWAEPTERALIPVLWSGAPWSGNEIMLHVQEDLYAVGQNPSYLVLIIYRTNSPLAHRPVSLVPSGNVMVPWPLNMSSFHSPTYL